MSTADKQNRLAAAGLPESSSVVDNALRESGIDPDRLSILHLGRDVSLRTMPRSLSKLLLGFGLWLCAWLAEDFLQALPAFVPALTALLVGLVILVAACDILVSATERLAERFRWNHYTAGTLAEILSTIPELVVIAFIIPVSPASAFIISLITIYNNALVFSLYSFFLPKDKQGKFLMPAPITEAGTQILIDGGAMGLILGLVMLTFNSSSQAKSAFGATDLVFVSIVLLAIFAVYLYKLVSSYAEEESGVRKNLAMSATDVEERLQIVYKNVNPSSFHLITFMFLAGILGAFVGGHQVSEFAKTMIGDLGVTPIFTALLLAVFAGMSEYIILWQSHRKQEHGIALANAFGGITQVMFLVLPFTLLGIALYQSFLNPAHPDLPLPFSLSNIFLLLFLFPTFYTLSSLLEEDHTLGILDTTIMTGIFLFLISLLVGYGAIV